MHIHKSVVMQIIYTYIVKTVFVTVLLYSHRYKLLYTCVATGCNACRYFWDFTTFLYHAVITLHRTTLSVTTNFRSIILFDLYCTCKLSQRFIYNKANVLHCGMSVSELLVHHWGCTRQYGSYVVLQLYYTMNRTYTKLCIGRLGRASYHSPSLRYLFSAVSVTRQALSRSFLRHGLSSCCGGLALLEVFG